MYYIFIENGKTNGCGQCKIISEGFKNIEVSEDIYREFTQDNLTYVYDGTNIIPNPNYEQDKLNREREEKDLMILTPTDVERALYKAKKMDFEDLKSFIAEKLPEIDIKALAIEFRAKDFYRGAKLEDGTRLIDTVGALLGYTSDDMDYLFENKELPE